MAQCVGSAQFSQRPPARPAGLWQLEHVITDRQRRWGLAPGSATGEESQSSSALGLAPNMDLRSGNAAFCFPV